MVFTYTASVILLALAMFGTWCFIKDLWNWLLRPQLLRLPSVTFLVTVQDNEQDIEMMLRYLLRAVADSGAECDVVVVDCDSRDLTPGILRRLAEELPGLQVCQASGPACSLAAALPLCRGAVIHVLDTVHRLSCDEFMTVVCGLLRGDCLEIAVRKQS